MTFYPDLTLVTGQTFLSYKVWLSRTKKGARRACGVLCVCAGKVAWSPVCRQRNELRDSRAVFGRKQSLRGVVRWSAAVRTTQTRRAKSKENKSVQMYSSAPVSTGNKIQ
jgi:hypothetical protein